MRTRLDPTAFPSLLSGAPALGKNAVLCIGIDLQDRPEEWREAALPCVTDSEVSNAQRLRQPLDATRHLVGRALVRTLLARELDTATLRTEFATNPWGKPALPDYGIEFNLAHSGGAIWAAFCRGVPVGIDVEEENDPADLHALTSILHPAERAELLALPMQEAHAAFLRCWARKEAVVKALGEGLSKPLSGFRVHTADCSGNWLIEAPAIPGAGWTTADLPVTPGRYSSVAAMAPGLTVNCFPMG